MLSYGRRLAEFMDENAPLCLHRGPMADGVLPYTERYRINTNKEQSFIVPEGSMEAERAFARTQIDHDGYEMPLS